MDRLTKSKRVALFVASDLSWFVCSDDERAYLADDLTQRDADRLRTYRRASQAWLSWLAQRIATAGARISASQHATWAELIALARTEIPDLDLSARPSATYQPPGIRAAART